MVDHDTLIDTLCDEAPPVRRVAPARYRALAWAPVALGAGYLATQFIHRSATDWAGPLAGIAAANIALSLTLGLAAFIAALSVSVAGGAARLNLLIGTSAATWHQHFPASTRRTGTRQLLLHLRAGGRGSDDPRRNPRATSDTVFDARPLSDPGRRRDRVPVFCSPGLLPPHRDVGDGFRRAPCGRSAAGRDHDPAGPKIDRGLR